MGGGVRGSSGLRTWCPGVCPSLTVFCTSRMSFGRFSMFFCQFNMFPSPGGGVPRNLRENVGFVSFSITVYSFLKLVVVFFELGTFNNPRSTVLKGVRSRRPSLDFLAFHVFCNFSREPRHKNGSLLVFCTT